MSNDESTNDNAEQTSSTKEASLADAVLDNVTDIVAVTAIGVILVYHGTPTDATLAAIVSIALGKRYVEYKK